MRKNLYFQDYFGRENLLKNWILNWGYAISSFPTLLIEVFIRKDFGERYFTIFTALLAAATLAFLPYLFSLISDIWHPIHETVRQDMFSNSITAEHGFWFYYGSWYAFIAAFLFFAFRRHREITQSKSSFDFAKFSLYRGTMNPFFSTMKYNGKLISERILETVIEPLPFFIAGLLLFLLQQKLGILLMVSAVIYGLGYESSYVHGDNFVLDKIDEMICSEGLEKAFVEDAGPEETKGFQYRGKKPQTTEQRKKILPMMIQEDEVVVAR